LKVDGRDPQNRENIFLLGEIVREINVSCAGDPVHAGDKALTRETPTQRGRVNRYGYNMSGFLRFPPPIKLTTEILLKVALNNMLYMGLLMT
jgi:hypothetical protein